MTGLQAIHPARRRALVFPREHGAWGLLLVPLASGAFIGFTSASRLAITGWLSIAAVAAFFARTPIENALPGSPFRPRTRQEWIWLAAMGAAYGFIAVVSLGKLLNDNVPLIFWALAGVVCGLFVLQAPLKRFGRQGRVLGELAGALGLAAGAPAAYVVASGRLGSEAILLWGANWLFASDQIFYVQMRIRQARIESRGQKLREGLGFFLSQLTLAGVLLAALRAGLINSAVTLSFVPVLLRGFAWFLLPAGPPLEILRLGKSELGQAALFCLLLTMAFRF